jgi:hypothetical protein
LFSTYYLASNGIDFSAFSLKDCLYFDPDDYVQLVLITFVFHGFNFIDDGKAGDRVDKTKIIADWDIAQKHLKVCAKKGKNCSVCSKCNRTLMTLDALGKLDLFADVFDINVYKDNRIANLQEMIKTIANNKPNTHLYEFSKMVYDLFIQNDPGAIEEAKRTMSKKTVADLENVNKVERIEYLESRVAALGKQNSKLRRYNIALKNVAHPDKGKKQKTKSKKIKRSRIYKMAASVYKKLFR